MKLKTMWREIGKAVALVVMVIVIAGCSRRVYVPVETVRVERDTVAMLRTRVDSILERDTVRIEQKGDTVVINAVKWRERVKIRTDTLYRSRVDSVSVPVPVEVEKRVEIEKPLTWWERIRMRAGGIAIVAAVVGIAVWIRRRIMK